MIKRLNDPVLYLLIVMGVVTCILLFLVLTGQQPAQDEEPDSGPRLQPTDLAQAPMAPAKKNPPPGVPTRRTEEVKSQLPQILKKALERTSARDSQVSINDLIAVLLDENAPLKDRRQAAWSLARSGEEAALTALVEAMPDAPPYLKAAIAEALGHSPHPTARDLIVSILSSERNEVALRGAVRGIAALGGKEGVEILNEILNADQRPISVRAEAAEYLGTIAAPEALTALLKSYETLAGTDEDLAESILTGIGSRDLAETHEFFKHILDSPENKQELRVAAVEALEETSGDVGPFLLKYVSDSDPEVRAAAAWSLAIADDPGKISDTLIEILPNEGSPEVRKRIYQALENQESVNTEAIFSFALDEPDLGARLAASSLLAQNLDAGPDLQQQFDEAIVPELLDVAMNRREMHARLSAVAALRKARTPGAVAALRQIADQISDARVAGAAGRGVSQ